MLAEMLAQHMLRHLIIRLPEEVALVLQVRLQAIHLTAATVELG
jgi:hypothetical protein